MTTVRKTLATIAVTFTLFGLGSSAVTPVMTAEAKSYVVIAPSYGKKSHHSKHCRGLNAAKSKKYVTSHWAKTHHYPKCAWCYR